MEYKGRLIIATYSDKRAQKDKHEREEKVRRAAQLLKHPSQLNKKAHHYFLKKEGTDKYILNQERIEKVSNTMACLLSVLMPDSLMRKLFWIITHTCFRLNTVFEPLNHIWKHDQCSIGPTSES